MESYDFVKNTLDQIPQAAADARRIVGLVKENGRITGYQLFHTLAFCTRVVVAVTFQKVNHAPDTKASAQGNHESLKNIHSRVKEFHNVPP